MAKDLKLKNFGERIEQIDLALMALLKKRSALTKQVALYKIRNGQKFVRLNVEKQRINAVRKWAKTNGIDPNFAQQILYSVINESCKQQLVELEKSL
jgi:chorismate mutase